MEPIDNTRTKELEQAEILLQKVARNAELEIFDEPIIEVLKEAMELFEKWEVEEKMAEIYLYKATYLNKQNKGQEALDILQKILKFYSSLLGEENEEVARVYKEMGRSYYCLKDFKLALKYNEKALSMGLNLFGKIHPLIVSCYQNKASIVARKLDYKKSVSLNKEALEIAQQLKKPTMIASIYCGIGFNYLMMSVLDKSETYLFKALEIHRKYNPLPEGILGELYYSLGILHDSLSDFDKAILFFKKALELFMKISDHYFAASVHHQMGIVYSNKKEYFKCIECKKQTIQLLIKSGHQDEDLFGTANRDLGRYYLRLNKLELSYDCLNKALENKMNFYKKENSAIGSIYYVFGEYYTKAKNYTKAIEYFQKAENALDQDPNSLDIDYFDLWTHMGDSYIEQGEYLKSVEFQHKAVSYAIKHSDIIDIYEKINISFEEIKKLNISHSFLIELIASKGYAFLHYYLNSTKNIKDLFASLENFELVIQIANEIQSSFYSDEAKLSLAGTMNRCIVYFARVNYMLFECTDETKYLDTIFSLSEKSKAYLLLQNTQVKSIRKTTSIPLNLIKQEEKLQSRLISVQKKIQSEEQKNGGTDKELLQKWQNDYFLSYNEFEALKKRLESEYPDYHRQKYSTKTVSISSLQSSLQENQTVLSYFIGEEKIYLFAITSNEYEVFPLEKTKDWETLIQQYLQSIKLHQKIQFYQFSFELYQTLLQEATHHLIDPFEDEPKQVFIIPHAELHYLPFETLIIQETDASKPYQDLEYLLNHCQISYHYSATLLHLDLQKQTTAECVPTEIAFTGFAPVYESSSNGQKQALKTLQSEYAASVNRSEAVRSDDTWIPLPHSKIEVENISQLFEKQGFKNQIFLYEAANKSNLEAQIGNSRFVLIAAHGIVNDKYPELSGLVLAENTKGSGALVANENKELNSGQTAIEDCILNMKEVAMIPMNADLVVLSSCESGIGELHKGEGMIAVNRGFLASGAKNVVSTLFKVNDRASSELTQLMFAHILKGENYVTALQKAKLELLKRNGMSPKMWSGFVLFGMGR